MEGTPEHIHIGEVIALMEEQKDILDVHHVHIWKLDEQRTAMEAHVLLTKGADLEQVKSTLKLLLSEHFKIEHSMFEFEFALCTKKL